MHRHDSLYFLYSPSFFLSLQASTLFLSVSVKEWEKSLTKFRTKIQVMQQKMQQKMEKSQDKYKIVGFDLG